MQDRILVGADGTARHELDSLGPWPVQTVAMFVDLGLSETEIARYFRIDDDVVQSIAGSGGPRPAAAPMPNTLPCATKPDPCGVMTRLGQRAGRLWRG